MPTVLEAQKQKLAKEKVQYDIKRGCELATLRIRGGFKAQYIAAKMRIHRSHLSDLEHGRRHWNVDLEAAFLKAIGQTNNQTKKGNQNANGRSARG